MEVEEEEQGEGTEKIFCATQGKCSSRGVQKQGMVRSGT